MPCGNSFASACIFCGDLLRDVERIGPGRLEDREAGGLLSVEVEKLAIGLGAELDTADVAQSRQISRGAGFDDDVGELRGIVEAARNVDVYWND